MDITKISIGDNYPEEVNAIIEVPRGGDPVKYELDKASGIMRVDRLLYTAMYYPCNYGFIPDTLSEDGDPADILVACQPALVPGSVITVRPVGVLLMEDESGMDEKILSVPTEKIDPFSKHIHHYADLPDILLKQIGHFFEHYKDLEKGKWVKIIGWKDKEHALNNIRNAVTAAKDAA